jgi:NAD(P)-dependent dehydrogenase (short-subunit alcohol dehydrogenase family)
VSLSELFGLNGKAALVTGAAKGIGRDVAETLAAAGAAVACGDVDTDCAQAVAERIESGGGRAIAMEMDCGDEASIVRATAEAADALGRLDVLVNNAGIYPPMMLDGFDAGAFDRLQAVNLRGVFLCTREAAKAMRASGDGGAIVNVSSIDGLHPSFPGLGPYGATKAAVLQLTRAAALELAGSNIRVNAICPGPIRTEGTAVGFDAGMEAMVLPRLPLGRIGSPTDVSGMILALVSPAAAFVTGAYLVVDGGYLIS